jgi:hypothetical protein
MTVAAHTQCPRIPSCENMACSSNLPHPEELRTTNNSSGSMVYMAWFYLQGACVDTAETERGRWVENGRCGSEM